MRNAEHRAAPDHEQPGGALPWFVVRQVVLVAGAIVAYFGVRGLTEGSAEAAHDHARWVYDAERAVGLAFETRIQDAAASADAIVTLGNWIYIWCHWPLVAGTLIWLLWAHRDDYIELRNAMFISGAIGLVIFATFPVAPPRLYADEFVDTVTQQSSSYRVLQPPAFVNAYAALPSLHFGWNLLVGHTWARVGRTRWSTIAGVTMPVAMAWAVVVTANHWILDVLAGGLVALTGLAIERLRRRLARPAGPADDARRDGGRPPSTSDAASALGPEPRRREAAGWARARRPGALEPGHERHDDGT